MHRLEVSHAAHRQISSLPVSIRDRINEVIALLAENPRPFGNKKLTAREGYRIKVGDFRILYLIDDTRKIITVYRVLPRGSAYRF